MVAPSSEPYVRSCINVDINLSLMIPLLPVGGEDCEFCETDTAPSCVLVPFLTL